MLAAGRVFNGRVRAHEARVLCEVAQQVGATYSSSIQGTKARPSAGKSTKQAQLILT